MSRYLDDAATISAMAEKPYKVVMQLKSGYVPAPYMDERAIQLFNHVRGVIGASVVYYQSESSTRAPITVECTNANPYNPAEAGLFATITCADPVLKEKVKATVKKLQDNNWKLDILSDPQQKSLAG